MNRISPPYLKVIFSFAVDVTGHSGRNMHRLFVPRIRTNYSRHIGAVIWNRLSAALYGVKTLKKLKTLYCFYAYVITSSSVC